MIFICACNVSSQDKLDTPSETKRMTDTNLTIPQKTKEMDPLRKEHEFQANISQTSSKIKKANQSNQSRLNERYAMVKQQLLTRRIHNQRVLDTMKKVPRELFIPNDRRSMAYGDHPVRIDYRQTISQPYIVAYMTESISPSPNHKVLEIGTGSGYQAAVLSELVKEVYTIEIIKPLGIRAKKTLTDLGYTNIQFRIGDGYAGWAEAAPFDAIILTAAPPKIPQPLLNQLAIGGVLIAPVGKDSQSLIRVTRNQDGFQYDKVMDVRFVPMTGKAQK